MSVTLRPIRFWRSNRPLGHLRPINWSCHGDSRSALERTRFVCRYLHFDSIKVFRSENSRDSVHAPKLRCRPYIFLSRAFVLHVFSFVKNECSNLSSLGDRRPRTFRIATFAVQSSFISPALGLVVANFSSNISARVRLSLTEMG